MIDLALAFLVFAVAAVVVVRGIMKKGGIFEFPALFSIILLGFLGPQVFWVIVGDAWLPEGSLSKVLLMALLSTLAVVVGHELAMRTQFKPRYEAFSIDGLNTASAVASVMGIGFLLALNFLTEEVTSSSQWTGTPTAYLFFARASSIALSVAAMVLALSGHRMALYICIANSVVMLDRALAFGRRGDLSEWLFIVSLAVWFGRAKAPSRTHIVAAIVAAALALNFIGAYRAAISHGVASNTLFRAFEIDWTELLHVGWSNALEVKDDTASELRNAARDIDAIDAEMTFDFGMSLWNTLVFNYFPAQLFGEAAKNHLYIDLESARVIEDAYEPWAGSTKTGFSDSFASFWYFGALIFGFISYVMGRLYKHAIGGSFFAAVVYMNLLSPALHALTHHTHWFLSSVPGLFLFLLPILAFARFPTGKAQHTASGGVRIAQIGAR